MVRLPKLGPKVADTPTDLEDDDATERMYSFARLTEGKLVPTRRLLWLAVVQAGKLDIGERTALRSAHETFTLSPHTVVMTKQEFVGAGKINWYVQQLAAGESIKPVRVTDVAQAGDWWHLDGLHRLLAARILGLPVDAEIYR